MSHRVSYILCFPASSLSEYSRLWMDSTCTDCPSPSISAYTLFATTTRSTPDNKLSLSELPNSASYQFSGNDSNFTALLLLVIRLPQHFTDIVITINIPHIVASHASIDQDEGNTYRPGTIDLAGGTNGKLVDEGLEIRKRILKTFEILDWGLFGEGGL